MKPLLGHEFTVPAFIVKELGLHNGSEFTWEVEGEIYFCKVCRYQVDGEHFVTKARLVRRLSDGPKTVS